MTWRLVLPAMVVFFGGIMTAEGMIIREELTPDLGEVQTPVVAGQLTDVSFPPGSAIADYGMGSSIGVRLEYVSPTKLRVFTDKDSIRTNLNITLVDGRQITLRFAARHGWTIGASRVEFYEPGTMPRSLAVAEADLQIGKWLSGARRVDTPRDMFWRRYGQDLVLTTGYIVHTEDAVLLPVSLRTKGEPLAVEELRLEDDRGREIDAQLMYAEHDLLARNAEVNQDKPLVAAFIINKPHQIINGWSVVAKPVGRAAEARFNWRDRRQRGPLQNTLAVAVYALGGMGNLDDGVGNNETAWAPVQGGGAQLTYGISRHISIQGAFDLTKSNGTMFEDAVWDQDQGQLQVDETAGRVFASGMVHTAGKRWVPYARLSLGVRLTKRELHLGTRSESVFRSGLLAGFGGGVNILLGKRMMAGFAMGYSAPLGGSDTAEGFEIGFALAGLWPMGR